MATKLETRVTASHMVTRNLERELSKNGCKTIVGLDEVGRGSWAGPLVIVATCVPLDGARPEVNDSKKISSKKRESLYVDILEWCLDWSIGLVTSQECDEFGMSQALKLAGERALSGLHQMPDHYILDGKWNFLDRSNVTTVVGGDATCVSLSTASILAKVYRDRLMQQQDENYPAYNFVNNKGYPCWRHKYALGGYGLTSIHRRSWKYIYDLPWTCYRNNSTFGSVAKKPELQLF